MYIKDKTIIIKNFDFDHIMSWSDNPCPSEAFKEGLEEEMKLSGINKEEFNKIEINFDY